MCDPISLIGFGLSAASAVTGYEAQSAQADAQNEMYAQNRANAMQAFADTQVALNQREMQTQAATGQQLEDNALKTQAAQATATAAGAAGGVQGLSLEGILGDYGAKNARAAGDIQTNEAWDMNQLQSEKVGAADQEVSRINSVQQAIKPSFLDAGLRIASGGLTAETNFARDQYYGMGGNFANPLTMGGFK